MIEYVLESAVHDPYENEEFIKKWIATFYSIRKEEGQLKKDCIKRFFKSRSLAPNEESIPEHWRNAKESRYDDDVPIWDITMEQLQQAYKTTAMERSLNWDSDLTYEEETCFPWYKRSIKIGNFPRRIPWLYIKDGINKFCILAIYFYQFCYELVINTLFIYEIWLYSRMSLPCLAFLPATHGIFE